MLPETLCAFLLIAVYACMVWLVVKHERGRANVWFAGVTMGLCTGLLCVTRPQYLFVPLVVVAFSVWRFRREVMPIAMVTLLAIGPVLAWSVFNYARLGYFGPTTQAGFSLTNHTGAYIEDAASRYPAIVSIYRAERDRRGGNQVNVIWTVQDDLVRATGLSYPQLSRDLTSMSLYLIRTHPFRYATQVFGSAVGFWKGTGLSDAPLGAGSPGLRHSLWVAAKGMVVLVNGVFLLCVAMFCIPRERRRLGSRDIQLAWGFGALLVMLSCLVQAFTENGDSPRFGMPIGAIVAALAVSFFALRFRLGDGAPASSARACN